MGRLTTHVLDTANGKPGNGIAISLYALDGDRNLLTTTVTNADGRTDRPLLDEGDFKPYICKMTGNNLLKQEWNHDSECD